MKRQILQLLRVSNMTAGELRLILKCRHEALYADLISLEASGAVQVWAKSRPTDNLWCIA